MQSTRVHVFHVQNLYIFNRLESLYAICSSMSPSVMIHYIQMHVRSGIKFLLMQVMGMYMETVAAMFVDVQLMWQV